MFVSAFQSYLFNCALSQRFDDGHTLTGPVEGDRVIFTNGRTDTVTRENLHAVSLHIGRGRCSIALFMPGREPFGTESYGEKTTASLLEKWGITAENFAGASTFVRTKFDGAWRPIALKTAIESDVEETSVHLKFTLPPGHYATTVCRKFMKEDTGQDNIVSRSLLCQRLCTLDSVVEVPSLVDNIHLQRVRTPELPGHLRYPISR